MFSNDYLAEDNEEITLKQCVCCLFSDRDEKCAAYGFFSIMIGLKVPARPALNAILYLCAVRFIMLFSIVHATAYFRVLNYVPSSKMVITRN